MALKNPVIEQPLPFQRPLVAQPGKFVVLVRGDTTLIDDKPSKGRYEVANKTFDTHAEAAFYAEGCSASREPVVAVLVTCVGATDWTGKHEE